MATFDWIFDRLGLRDWCGEGGSGPMNMAQLLAQARAVQVGGLLETNQQGEQLGGRGQVSQTQPRCQRLRKRRLINPVPALHVGTDRCSLTVFIDQFTIGIILE